MGYSYFLTGFVPIKAEVMYHFRTQCAHSQAYGALPRYEIPIALLR